MAGRRAVQGVRDQQVGDHDQRGPAQREQRRVEQRQPRPGAEVAVSQPVADADDGLDQRRVAELAPQPPDGHRDRVAERVGVSRPTRVRAAPRR